MLISNLYTLLYRLETAMKKAPKARDSRVSSSAPSNEPENHEETLNFSNLTEFRNSLLQVIPKLQEDDLLRFVITKHGQPAAVIMSYHAYSVFKRIADRVIEQDDALDPEESLRQAYARMNESEYKPIPEAAQIAESLEQLAVRLKNISKRENSDTERAVDQLPASSGLATAGS
jgi:prevent-host-death family protein